MISQISGNHLVYQTNNTIKMKCLPLEGKFFRFRYTKKKCINRESVIFSAIFLKIRLFPHSWVEVEIFLTYIHAKNERIYSLFCGDSVRRLPQ